MVLTEDGTVALVAFLYFLNASTGIEVTPFLITIFLTFLILLFFIFRLEGIAPLPDTVSVLPFTTAFTFFFAA